MARQNSGDHPPSSALSPFATPSGGMPMPVSPAGPYGPNLSVSAPGAKAAPTPAGLFNALRRRWVLATFLGLLVASLAGVGAWAVMPSGKHNARVLVGVRASAGDIGARANEDFETYRKEQAYLIKSRDLILRVLAEPAVAQLETIKNADDPIRFLEDGIKIEAPSPTILAVNLTGDHPEDLKIILDMLTKKFVEDSTSYDNQSRNERLRRLEDLAQKFKDEIAGKESRITVMAQMGTSSNADAMQAKQARMQQELARIEAEEYTTKKDLEELKVNADLLQSKINAKRIDLNSLDLEQLVNNDPRVLDPVLRRRAKERLLTSARQVASDDSAPTVVALREEVALLDKEISAARKVVEPEVQELMKRVTEQDMRNRLADLVERINAMRALYEFRRDYRDNFEKRTNQSSKADFQMSVLVDELKPQKEYLHAIEAKRVGVQVEKGLEPRVSIRESAVVILNHNIKQKTMVSTSAAVAGFLGVIVLIGFLEWRTRRIDGVDQVVTELGMRVIGTVPAFPNRASLKAAEAAGNANWRFILNEAINSTRTMLLHTARSQSMQVVMVTSATQGEGKTSLASQLGSSMAAAGMRTLIVDCDLRNPSIHKLFELELSNGVSEVLCQDADVSDAVQPTAVPNLWIIPAGKCSNRVITALAQNHPLETLFNRLRGQFDFIVVDSCPVLPVADALLIGQHVDGVVFSIMQDISQLPKVIVASEKLQQLNIPLLGAVVNGVTTSSAYYAYGYNYVKQLPA